MRQRFKEITDRFAAVQAQNLNVHGQFDVLARLAQPVVQGKTKVSGIKLEQKRILRLLEVLLQGAGGHLKRWTTAQLHQTVLEQCDLKEKDYTLNQIRYDLRKIRLHCVFRRNRTLIPIIVGHLFRSISDSYRSGATLGCYS